MQISVACNIGYVIACAEVECTLLLGWNHRHCYWKEEREFWSIFELMWIEGTMKK